MKKLTIIAFTFLSFCLSAQDESSYHLITYLNIQVSSGTVETQLPDGTDPIRSFERTSFSLGNFSPALGIYHANGSLSEIELTTLSFGSEDRINLIEGNNRDVAGKTTMFGLGVRYEYDFPLFQKDALSLYAGASVNPTILSKNLKPDSEFLYTTKTGSFRLPFAIIPKVIYNMGERFFMTYSIPITILEIASNSIKYESTVVPSGGEKISDGATTFLPARTHIRIGVGAKF